MSDDTRAPLVAAGADEPRPAVPAVVRLGDQDGELAAAAWDDTMPDWKGMLDAVVLTSE